MTKTHRNKAAPAADPVLPDSAAGHVPGAPAAYAGGVAPADPMAEFGIEHDGRSYYCNGYRYDRLADAVAYATLMRSRPGRPDPPGSSVCGTPDAPPSDADWSLMTTLGIEFRDGHYCFASYRYDRLTDAVNYAILQQGHRRAAPRV